MDKKSAVEFLKKKGYSAELEGNIPIVALSDKSIKPEKIKALLAEAGYEASFGCKYGNVVASKVENTDNLAEEVASQEKEDLDTVDTTETASKKQAKKDPMDDLEPFDEPDFDDSILSSSFLESDDGQMSFF